MKKIEIGNNVLICLENIFFDNVCSVMDKNLYDVWDDIYDHSCDNIVDDTNNAYKEKPSTHTKQNTLEQIKNTHE